MIKGFGKQGNIKEAFDLIKEMESSGLMSSSDTLCNVLVVSSSSSSSSPP